MPDIHAIAVKLPDPRLPGADWADSFEILVPVAELSAVEAAQLSIGRMPGWVHWLTRLRNLLVRPLGLKTGADPAVPSGERIGIFPVLSRDDASVVLGLDDWHLDFRLIVETRQEGSHTSLRATTLVKRKNLFGRVYILFVTPFHKLIVRRALLAAA
jgi:hypothetical protein